MDAFEKAAAELESSIKVEKASTEEPQDFGKAIVKGITDAVTNLLKGKKGSDLSAEEDKRGELTDTEEDPAKSPSKSGKGYPDSKPYVSRKAEDEHDEDEEDDKDEADEDEDDGDEGGKELKKRGMKKSSFDYDDDEDAVDVTPFLKSIAKSIRELNDHSRHLEKGLSIFGELLSEMSDPSRDKLNVAMAKGITYLTDKFAKLEKSVEQHNTLIKSIAEMPGMPKVAGVASVLAKADEAPQAKITDIDRDKLFKAAAHRKITTAEFNRALKSGDLACLNDVKF